MEILLVILGLYLVAGAIMAIIFNYHVSRNFAQTRDEKLKASLYITFMWIVLLLQEDY